MTLSTLESRIGILKVSGPIVSNGDQAAKGWVRVPRGSAIDGHFVAFSQEDAVRELSTVS